MNTSATRLRLALVHAEGAAHRDHPRPQTRQGESAGEAFPFGESGCERQHRLLGWLENLPFDAQRFYRIRRSRSNGSPSVVGELPLLLVPGIGKLKDEGPQRLREGRDPVRRQRGEHDAAVFADRLDA